MESDVVEFRFNVRRVEPQGSDLRICPVQDREVRTSPQEIASVPSSIAGRAALRSRGRARGVASSAGVRARSCLFPRQPRHNWSPPSQPRASRTATSWVGVSSARGCRDLSPDCEGLTQLGLSRLTPYMRKPPPRGEGEGFGRAGYGALVRNNDPDSMPSPRPRRRPRIGRRPSAWSTPASPVRRWSPLASRVMRTQPSRVWSRCPAGWPSQPRTVLQAGSPSTGTNADRGNSTSCGSDLDGRRGSTPVE